MVVMLSPVMVMMVMMFTASAFIILFLIFIVYRLVIFKVMGDLFFRLGFRDTEAQANARINA